MEPEVYLHDTDRPYHSPLVLRGMNTFFACVPERHEETGPQRLCSRTFSIEEAGIPTDILQQWYDVEIVWCSLLEDDGTPAQCGMDDLVWMHIVEHLFGLGLSEEFVAKVAGSALDQVLAWEEEESWVFYDVRDVYVWLALRQQVPAVLVVFETGVTSWFSFDEYVALWDIYQQNPPHHFVVSLNRIGQQLKDRGLLSDDDPTTTTGTQSTAAPLSSKELQVIQTLREGTYERVTIRTNDGNIESMEGEEIVTGKRFTDLLDDSDFQDIHVRKRNGKIVHAKRTILQKFPPQTDWKNQR